MNVTEALQARASIRAYKTEPVEGRLIAEILEVALRSPSWANSQPWEVFVVGGEPLERLREGSLERTRQGVKGVSELPAPTSWPDDAQARVDAMIAGRAQHAGVYAGRPGGPAGLPREQPPLFWRPGGRLSLPGQGAHRLVHLRRGGDVAEHHAGRPGTEGGFDSGREPERRTLKEAVRFVGLSV